MNKTTIAPSGQESKNDELVPPIKAMPSKKSIARMRKLVYGEETKETMDMTRMTIGGERMDMSDRKPSAAYTSSPDHAVEVLLEITKEEISGAESSEEGGIAGQKVPSTPKEPAMSLDWQDRQDAIQASYSRCDEYPGLEEVEAGFLNDGHLMDN